MQLNSNQHRVGIQIIERLTIAATLFTLMASPAIAEESHDREGAREHHELVRHEAVRDHHVFAIRDVHQFNHVELKLWRGGRWNQSCFLGRCGWWWFAEGQWYFYDRPVYPYPLMVSEVTYIDPIIVPNTVVPLQNPVVVPQTPVMVAPQAPAPAPPAPQTWYYCASAKNYYPYVPNCPEGWQAVPAQPPQAPPR